MKGTNIYLFKKRIKDIVDLSYHKQTKFRFTGWYNCIEDDEQSSGTEMPTIKLKGIPTLGMIVQSDTESKIHQ